MTRGEEVKVLTDYDLFGNSVKDEKAIFIKKDNNTNKCLLYFPDFAEWGELPEGDLLQVNPGHISEESADFVSRIQTMKVTFEV